MAHATSTKSWLWHQRLSRLNFDTINNRAKDNLVTGLPKFKYSEDHLYPSCEQRKSKKSPHKLKPVPNSKNRLHLLHMNLYRPMRVESINGKRYVLVIVDDYSRYTWVHFLRSKDEAPEVIKIFLKQIQVLLQALVIINDLRYWKLGAKVISDSLLVSLITFWLTEFTSEKDKEGGQPSDATRTAPATTTTLNAKTLSTPTNSSSHAPTITNTS
ncbi:retrovirus-related pol polyprotein from transposon TNT 1-94 [Tanacetum coccineum]|uniref:Retrovirus-related pol polyprotein from transposon TNT 1-94 n=1 Tax=Tanacetum coccineum TaxID=301880 RepID=A0ABQ4X387_9ASTR